MTRHLPLALWSRALRSTSSFKLTQRGFSSGGDPPSVDDAIGDFVNRKWKKKSSVDAAAQVWPTDRALNDAVAPAPELQGHWESLERRVAGRRPRSDRPSGRVNLRKGEEDFWLAGGAYDGLGILAAPAAPQAVDGSVSPDPVAPLAVALPSPPPLQPPLQPLPSERPRGLVARLSPGEVARHAVVAVGGGAAAAFAAAYGEQVHPAAAALPGFRRALLLHDARSSTVHALSVWADAASLAAAGDDASYAAAMAHVAKRFAGPPQISDLQVLAEFGPAATGSGSVTS